MGTASATPAPGGVDVAALAVEVASALRGRVVYRRNAYRFKVRSGIGKPLPNALIVAIVAANLPRASIPQTEILARCVVGSDEFKEALG
ncbi:hypothetical protein K0817_009330 [Microbacterium sp. HD4P20]|uniref:hypothetical protein n=1 Tax=Microbacterium sp. HD4P20 TaxID=2864874 RepID=UPI001C6439EA|nr:hypothetical protein [Microbacterium sp. HD4P20]MCP2636765.1 hypothetical protein [Microbacterium sp. HD4P20]